MMNIGNAEVLKQRKLIYIHLDTSSFSNLRERPKIYITKTGTADLLLIEWDFVCTERLFLTATLLPNPDPLQIHAYLELEVTLLILFCERTWELGRDRKFRIISKLYSHCSVFFFINFHFDSFCMFTLFQINIKTLRKLSVHTTTPQIRSQQSKVLF